VTHRVKFPPGVDEKLQRELSIPRLKRAPFSRRTAYDELFLACHNGAGERFGWRWIEVNELLVATARACGYEPSEASEYRLRALLSLVAHNVCEDPVQSPPKTLQ
jgi:hypothetical protein